MGLAREVASGTVARYLAAAAGLVASIVVADILGPSAYGGVALLVALGKFADRPVQGFARAGKQRIAANPAVTPVVLGALLAVTVGWIVAFAVVSAVAAPLIVSYAGLAAAPFLLLLLVASDSAFESVETLAQGRGRIAAATWSSALRVSISAPLQIALVVAGVGAAGVVYGETVAAFAAAPVAAYFVGARPAVPGRAVFADLWSYARSAIPDAALGTAYERLSLVIIGVLLTPALAGNYQVAWALTLPAVYLSEVAATGLMAQVAARETAAEVRDDVRNTLSYSSLLAVPILVGALVYARELVVGIYSAEYARAAPLLVGLALYRYVRTESGPLIQAINGIDRPEVAVRITALAVLVNLALGVALVFPLAAVGVVVAIVVGDVVRMLGAWYFLRSRLDGVDLYTPAQRDQFAAAAAMGAVLLGVKLAARPSGLLEMIVVVGVGAAVYVGGLALSESHRALAADALGDTRLARFGFLDR